MTLLRFALACLVCATVGRAQAPPPTFDIVVRHGTVIEAKGLFVTPGFNAAWQKVNGNGDKRPSSEEIQQMRAAISAGLDQGAWGVSAGLDYKPGYFARTEEVIKVVDVARSSRTNFTNHDRITPESNYSSKVGVTETVAIGQKAGLVPVVTHMKAQGLGSLIIPGWAQEGGRDAMLKRFADPAQRARIITESEQAMTARFGGPQGVYLPRTQQELTAVMKEMNAGAGETILRILETGDPGAILRFGSEADLVKILAPPTTSMACDCGASTATRVHPRFTGVAEIAGSGDDRAFTALVDRRDPATPGVAVIVVMIEGETPWRGVLPLGAVSTK